MEHEACTSATSHCDHTSTLDCVMIESSDDGTRSEKEQTHGLEVNEGSFARKDDTVLTEGVKLAKETSGDDRDNIESAKRPRHESEGSGSSAKKPKLEMETMHISDGRDDRRRNKSTAASVLLGLVKSRVRKLANERRKTAAETTGSCDIAVSPSTPTAAGTVLTKSCLKKNKNISPGQCLST